MSSAPKEFYTTYRNLISRGLYKNIVKPFLFSRDPEYVHDMFTRIGIRLGSSKYTRSWTRNLLHYRHPMLYQEIAGMTFENPIGLSAGFDKNAMLIDIMPSVGFGFMEVGSITGEVCEGNPAPRLWRLPDAQSLVVYYGLKNDGCEAIAHRLQLRTPKRAPLPSKYAIPVGVSVAVTNACTTVTTDEAIADYCKAFRVMEPYASYLTINISCPNTYGGQPFTDPIRLEALLSALDAIPTHKPIFVKLAPDYSFEHIDTLLAVICAHRVTGVICTNLTKQRTHHSLQSETVPEQGGMSGKVVQDTADALLAHVYKRVGKQLVCIGSGGVFTAEDAYRKIRLGAHLVQLITGMVFEGPQVISTINQGLVTLLRRDGFTSIAEAVGSGIDTKIQ